MSLTSNGASSCVDWISEGYRPLAKPLSLLRIAFAASLLFSPRDISWLSEMSVVAYDPPPGPFALLPGPPSYPVVIGLEILRAVLALVVLVGWKTKLSSALLSFVLVICSGLTYSYGKVDHMILYDLAPLMLGLAGWGSVWSLDSQLANSQRSSCSTSGYAIFVYANLIAFGMFTAAAAKIATGWLVPGREASRFFVAEAATGVRVGPLTKWILQFDSSIFWKLVDYATIFAEGWLIAAVFVPCLFRIGLIALLMFHAGVWLLLGIDFHVYIFVYAAFFMVPKSAWLRELRVFDAWRRGLHSSTTKGSD